MQSQPRPSLLWPLLLVIIGVVILLNNFLIIDAEVVRLWPVLLVGLGLAALWRGDIAPSWQAHTFGITRGSVESGLLEVNSGEIDVNLRRLQRAGRLIAGQYTARSRPRLLVRNNQARILMRRGDTWLFSLADWDVELAPDLPWSLVMSAHLGELKADLRGLNLRQAHIATGVGDIEVICPDQDAGPLYLRSTLGSIQVIIRAGWRRW
ncbi:MAG: hypothetical protein HC915_05525 [Anaerolineae bacterium]|nr:hypothetical protein [Anaerolineae bacterium]